MSLNYNLNEVLNWKQKVESESGSANLYCLCMALMLVGISRITLANSQKVFNRISAFEKLNGSMRRRWDKEADKSVDVPFTMEDIINFIGLKTNVTDKTPAQFAKDLVSSHKRDW